MVCLMISGRQYEEPELAGSYNVEPDEETAGVSGRSGDFGGMRDA